MNRYHDYPLADGESWPTIRRKTAKRRFRATLKWRFASLFSSRKTLHHIERLKKIQARDLVVMVRQRDGARFIRSILRHYRALGADWIVVVDDHSTDGTHEYLATQSDVILLPAAKSYGEASSGREWFNEILMALPRGQRVVIIDNDEYLVFSDGQANLQTLFDCMQRRGLTRLCCAMLDMYPPAPIKNAVFDGRDDRYPWEVATLLDAKGYHLMESTRGVRVTGGVRERLFGQDLHLSKFPVLFNPKKPVFDYTIHAPQPWTQNVAPVGGALLHFKYFSDFIDAHEVEVARGIHHRGGEAYQAVLDKLQDVDVGEQFDFTGDSTVRYEGPAQLCELGLIEDICKG